MTAKHCAVEGCPNAGNGGRGWCSTHYARWRTKGDPGPADTLRKKRQPLPPKPCEYCGRTFKPQRRLERISRFCSKACNAAGITKEAPPAQKECEHCGAPMFRRMRAKGFESPADFIRRRHCSTACVGAAVAIALDQQRSNVGDRSLVAKTCVRCHALRDASDSYRRRRDGMWTSECVSCLAEMSRDQFHKAQEASTLTAVHNGDYWTGAELEIAARADLTARQAAEMLGRTLSSVRYARWLLKNDPRRQRSAGLSEADR